MEGIIFIFGIFLGIIAVILLMNLFPVGTLRIDQSDPDDKPYLFLEMEKDLSHVKKQKYIIFRVNSQNYISRK